MQSTPPPPTGLTTAEILVTLAVALISSAIIPAILSYRKTRAEAKKTGVDSIAVMNDIAIELMTELRTELARTRDEVNRLQRMVTKMEAALVEYGANLNVFREPT